MPAVLAPSRFTQLFSAAAPGAATEAVTIEPALVPKVTLFALEKFRFPTVNEPLEADTVTAAPAPGAATEASSLTPFELTVIEPDMFVPLKVVAVPA